MASLLSQTNKLIKEHKSQFISLAAYYIWPLFVLYSLIYIYAYFTDPMSLIDPFYEPASAKSVMNFMLVLYFLVSYIAFNCFKSKNTDQKAIFHFCRERLGKEEFFKMMKAIGFVVLALIFIIAFAAIVAAGILNLTSGWYAVMAAVVIGVAVVLVANAYVSVGVYEIFETNSFLSGIASIKKVLKRLSLSLGASVWSILVVVFAAVIEIVVLFVFMKLFSLAVPNMTALTAAVAEEIAIAGLSFLSALAFVYEIFLMYALYKRLND